MFQTAPPIGLIHNSIIYAGVIKSAGENTFNLDSYRSLLSIGKKADVCY